MIERGTEGEKAPLIGTSHLELDGYFLLCEGEMDAWVQRELDDGRHKKLISGDVCIDTDVSRR